MRKSKTNYKNYKKSRDYMENTEYNDSSKPATEGDVAIGLNIKSMRSLPYSSYSVQADPYDASLPASRPYNIYARFNKKVGGGYKGLRNIDGGNVQQYANSVNSKFLNCFDFMRLKTSVNYRYRPTRLSEIPTPDESGRVDSDYVGAGLVDQCRQAIAEATSVLQATTFTQMGIYNYVIETDMPLGDTVMKEVTETVEGETVTHNVYYQLPDVIYGTTTFYQLVLQELLNFISTHNSYRLKMGTMIRSSWNRETPTLNSLFGLFKKKSFLSIIDSLCLTLPGEYVDKEWAVQMNTLNLMPSRRSNAITDPVLELQTRHVHPTIFKMYLINDDDEIIDTIFDLEKDFSKPIDVNTNLSFFDAIDQAQDYLSAEFTMNWARNNKYLVADSDNAYFNYVKRRIDIINLCMTTFKTRFNDIREVLDVVSRTGLVTWTKGFRPSITKDTDADLFDNQLINDIYAMTFGGAHEVVMDNITKRWRTFSLWNLYSGIPEYDTNSGGAFITFSAKDIVFDSDTDKTYRFLPIMFYYDSTTIGNTKVGTVIFATNRLGKQAYLKSKVITLSSDSNYIYNRLVPLNSQSNLKMRVPVIYAYDAENPLDYIDKSMLYKTMTQVFGSACIDNDYSLDPDVLAIYQLEMEDMTNESIAYARSTSPFRGSVSTEDVLGFSSFGKN